MIVDASDWRFALLKYGDGNRELLIHAPGLEAESDERAFVLLIVLADLALLAIPFASVLWYRRAGSNVYVDTGTTDGDSFGLVVGGLTIVCVIALVLITLLLRLALRDYPGSVTLLSRPESGTRALAFEALIAIPIALLLLALYAVSRDAAFEFIPSFVVLLYVEIAVRAARMGSGSRQEV